MRLKELLSEIPYTIISGSEDTEITSIAYDSRKVKQGSLFVCVTGYQTDGHAYAQQALEQGAAAIIVERKPDVQTTKTIVQVEDTREALAYLAAGWFGHPADRLCIIGITGTKGKTTTAHMVKKILEENGSKVGMTGTNGAYIGAERFPVKNTTPEPYELHRLFARMVEAGCQYVVMEVSSQALKQKRTAGIRFAYGAFLNISPDHIGTGAGEHADFAEYLSCKKLLFSQTGHAVANIDDSHWREVTEGADDITTISINTKADFKGSAIQNTRKPGILGVDFRLSGKLSGAVSLNMPGQFNVENALTAIAIAHQCGVGKEVMFEALEKVYVKGRTQLIQGASRFSTFLIDYAHNALSMKCLLETLKSYHPDRLICMFGGSGNKPKQRRFDMGRIAGKYADLSIITMDNPRYDSMEDINEDIVKGLEVYHGAYRMIPDRKLAIHYLIDNSRKNDIVVFVGLGHQEYQEVCGERFYFSEEEIVNEYLRTRGVSDCSR